MGLVFGVHIRITPGIRTGEGRALLTTGVRIGAERGGAMGAGGKPDPRSRYTSPGHQEGMRFGNVAPRDREPEVSRKYPTVSQGIWAEPRCCRGSSQARQIF